MSCLCESRTGRKDNMNTDDITTITDSSYDQCPMCCTSLDCDQDICQHPTWNTRSGYCPDCIADWTQPDPIEVRFDAIERLLHRMNTILTEQDLILLSNTPGTGYEPF